MLNVLSIMGQSLLLTFIGITVFYLLIKALVRYFPDK
jgi:hypothetical protein